MSDVAYQINGRLPVDTAYLLRYTSATANAKVTLISEWYEES